MAIANAHPMRFTPKGLTDSFDATDRFPGACQRLTNLSFDQSNPELVVSRPGVHLLIAFNGNGFLNPGFISIQVGIGTRIYGMIATSRNAGKDEPFCFDTATQLFVPISNVLAGNTPTSPATSGDWTPPTIASVGVLLIVTHPGFNGAGSNFFGTIDITNPAAPVWNAANTTGTVLLAVPTAVANFNNRAWFVVKGNQLWYTDTLTTPLNITNASQNLVIGDSSPVNALSGLPNQTTSSGIVSTLTIFKQSQVWQVGGDTSTANLSLNFVSLTVGTTSPRSVSQSVYGIYFVSSGGPYFIDAYGTLRPLTHSLQEFQPDVSAPFQNAITATRWASAYTASIYRICGQTVILGIGQTNDYWFDEHVRRWNGPHNFAYDCASVVNGEFVISSVNNPGQLLISEANSDLDAVYTDLGAPITFQLKSSTFPKVGDMYTKQVAESQIELTSAFAGITYTLQAQDDQNVNLATATVSVAGLGNYWGKFIWGDGTLWSQSPFWGGGSLWGSTAQGGSNGIWGQGQQLPHTYPVPWPNPFVFEKMQLVIQGTSSSQIGIGTFYARYQKTGWMTMGNIPP